MTFETNLKQEFTYETDVQKIRAQRQKWHGHVFRIDDEAL